MKVCFLVGSTDIGGGTYVIFEHALHLHRAGWQVTVVPVWPPDRSCQPWHPALEHLRFASLEEVAQEEFDLAVATWWRTIYDLLPRIRATRHCYFVQSIESWFYPNSDVAVRNLVNATYLLPMPGVTEARWIRAHLADRFGQDYRVVPNGCRKDIYRPDGPVVAPRQPGRLRVLVEGPLGVDFKNVARTIALLRRSAADEVWLLTASPVERYPGADRVFSRVPAAECGMIYRSCDVLVKLSTIEGMFGPPLEMFHCGGTAVVYDVTGHDEYIVNGRNALVARMGDEAAVLAAVDRLKREPATLAALCREALATAAAWPSWDQSSPLFEAALRGILADPPADRARLDVMIREFWAQYLRTERAQQPARGVRRIEVALARLGRRLPALAVMLRAVHARLLESRRQPAPRERI